jgi:hypothetical protein
LATALGAIHRERLWDIILFSLTGVENKSYSSPL